MKSRKVKFQKGQLGRYKPVPKSWLVIAQTRKMPYKRVSWNGIRFEPESVPKWRLVLSVPKWGLVFLTPTNLSDMSFNNKKEIKAHCEMLTQQQGLDIIEYVKQFGDGAHDPNF